MHLTTWLVEFRFLAMFVDNLRAFAFIHARSVVDTVDETLHLWNVRESATIAKGPTTEAAHVIGRIHDKDAVAASAV
jgi:hypothetical protein